MAPEEDAVTGKHVVTPMPEDSDFETISAPGGEDAEALIALKNIEKRRKAKRRAQRLKVAAALAVLAFVGGVFALRGLLTPKEEEGNAGPDVAVVERRDFSTSVQGSGTLKPYDSVVVTPEVDGIIDSVNVSEGQRVNVGEVLFTIRSESLDKAVSTASDQLAAAQSDLSDAYASVSHLEAALEADRTAYETAQAQAAIDTARAQEAYDQAYSAYSGLITEQEHAVASAQDKVQRADAAFVAAEDEYLKAVAEGADDIEEKRIARDNAEADSEVAHVVLKEAEESRAAAEEAAASAGKEAAAGIPITPVPEFSETAAQAQIEAARASVNTAENAVATATTAYDEAVEASSKKVVRAPKSGTVVSVGAVSGAAVGSGAQGTGSLVQIADVNKMKVSIEVNEIDISDIKEGQRAHCTFSALPGVELDGRVVSVASTSSGSEDAYGSGVVTYKVEVIIDQPNSKVKPGMTSNVTILSQDIPNALVIPTMALVEDSTGTHVFVVTDFETYATEMRTVKVRTRSSSDAVIESGLEEGETVLLSGYASTNADEAPEYDDASTMTFSVAG